MLKDHHLDKSFGLVDISPIDKAPFQKGSSDNKVDVRYLLGFWSTFAKILICGSENDRDLIKSEHRLMDILGNQKKEE